MNEKQRFSSELIRTFVSNHPRTFEDNCYVYPVISRRAGGVSIGVNLNPDKSCNFSCVYCQVDRSTRPPRQEISLLRLREELDEMLNYVTPEGLFTHPSFSHLPPQRRHVHDIAFSGDGEPTACPQFVDAVKLAAELRRERSLWMLKLVLITNASLLDRAQVEEGLAILDANNGEIWAKLDAGTEDYFARIARTPIKLQKIVDNICQTARKRPVVIQSLFMKINGQAPPPEELEAYCERLNDIRANGGTVKLVQVYTIARPPAEYFVAPLSRAELISLGELIRTRTGLPVAVFGPEG
ncbi:MAG: radical SAM protein [Thermoguttaceae bacterium]|nr:radical SAM protein [Thermoguttaceae bacterium]MDW8078196.1 radical SAM protein [Thermoguttaceae bacterium]